MSDYLSFQDVLEELQIGEEELKGLVANSKLRAFRHGKSMKYRRMDVENFKKGKRADGVLIMQDDGEAGLESELDSGLVRAEELLDFDPGDSADGLDITGMEDSALEQPEIEAINVARRSGTIIADAEPHDPNQESLGLIKLDHRQIWGMDKDGPVRIAFAEKKNGLFVPETGAQKPTAWEFLNDGLYRCSVSEGRVEIEIDDNAPAPIKFAYSNWRQLACTNWRKELDQPVAAEIKELVNVEDENYFAVTYDDERVPIINIDPVDDEFIDSADDRYGEALQFTAEGILVCTVEDGKVNSRVLDDCPDFIVDAYEDWKLNQDLRNDMRAGDAASAEKVGDQEVIGLTRLTDDDPTPVAPTRAPEPDPDHKETVRVPRSVLDLKAPDEPRGEQDKPKTRSTRQRALSETADALPPTTDTLDKKSPTMPRGSHWQDKDGFDVNYNGNVLHYDDASCTMDGQRLPEGSIVYWTKEDGSRGKAAKWTGTELIDTDTNEENRVKNTLAKLLMGMCIPIILITAAITVGNVLEGKTPLPNYIAQHTGQRWYKGEVTQEQPKVADLHDQIAEINKSIEEMKRHNAEALRQLNEARARLTQPSPTNTSPTPTSRPANVFNGNDWPVRDVFLTLKRHNNVDSLEITCTSNQPVQADQHEVIYRVDANAAQQLTVTDVKLEGDWLVFRITGRRQVTLTATRVVLR